MAPKKSKRRRESPPRADNRSYSPTDEPVPPERQAQQPTSADLMACLVDIRSQLASANRRVATVERKVEGHAAPTKVFERKGFQAQYDLNCQVQRVLEATKSALHDPDEAEALIQQAIDALASRNRKLSLADSYPGVLNLIDKAEELAALKDDPALKGLAPEILKQISQPPVQSFRGRGGMASQPSPRFGNQAQFYQQPQPLAFQPPALSLPNPSNKPYYQQGQTGPRFAIHSGNRQPRFVVGPCHHCAELGHYMRDCPHLHAASAPTPFTGSRFAAPQQPSSQQPGAAQ